MIKNHLSKLLGAKRITQSQLSQMTGIRPTTISDMYNEVNVRWNEAHIDRICEVLNCDLSDLLEYIPNTNLVTGNDLIVESHGNNKRKDV